MSQMKQIPYFVSKRQQKQFNLFNHVVKIIISLIRHCPIFNVNR